MNSPIENLHNTALSAPISSDFDVKWDCVTEQICPAVLKDDPSRPDPATHFQAFMAANKDRWQRTPASTKVAYHHAYAGGLFHHCCEVWNICLTVYGSGLNILPGLSYRSLFLGSFLHDVHKLGDAAGNDYYLPNILKSGKQSEAIPFEKNAAHLIPGDMHAEKTQANSEIEWFINHGVLQDLPGGMQSLAYIYATAPELYTCLTEDEQFAIKHHDGAYGVNKYTLAGKETPLMIVLHMADMLSSRLDSSRNKNGV